MLQSDKLLIICDSPIGDKDAGQKLLKNILWHERVFGIISSRKSFSVIEKFSVHIPVRFFREYRFLKYINRLPGVLFAAHVRMLIRILINIRTIKKFQGTHLIVLRGDAILMSYVIHRVVGNRFIVFIPDGLNCELHDGYIYDAVKSYCFNWLLRNCCGYLGASRYSSEVYASLKEKNFLGLLRPPYQVDGVDRTPILRHSEKLKVLYAGSSYAIETIRSFAKAISFVDNIEFHVAMEGDYKLDSIGANIFYLGWLSQQELDLYAIKMDILYMPYSFKSSDRERMIVGYPGKLGNYLELNRNIIFHAPEYSSIFREFNAIAPKWCLSTLDPSATKIFISNLDIENKPLSSYYSVWKKESSLEMNLNNLMIEENSSNS